MEEKGTKIKLEFANKLVFGSSSGNLYREHLILHGRPEHIVEVDAEGQYGTGTNADGTPTQGYRINNVQVGDVLEVESLKQDQDEPETIYLIVTE